MQTPNNRRKYRQRQKKNKREQNRCSDTGQRKPRANDTKPSYTKVAVARQNMEVFNETTVNGHDVGNMDNICSACGA